MAEEIKIDQSKNVVVGSGNRVVQKFTEIYHALGKKQFIVLCIAILLVLLAYVFGTKHLASKQDLVYASVDDVEDELAELVQKNIATADQVGRVKKDLLDTFSKGIESLKSENYGEAIRIFEELSKSARLASIHNNIGYAYAKAGNNNKAMVNFQIASSLQTKFTDSVENAKILYEHGVPPSPILGAQVVNFTSEVHYAKATAILDGEPNEGWMSDWSYVGRHVEFPEAFVIELPGEFLITQFSFDNAGVERLDATTKDVDIYVSLETKDLGYEKIASFTLMKGEIAQGFKLNSPVRARWIKLKILSNYGNTLYVTLGEFRIIGLPWSK